MDTQATPPPRFRLKAKLPRNQDAYDNYSTPEFNVRLSAFLRNGKQLAAQGHRLRSNLLPQQRAGLRFLKSRPDLVVWNTDKNLGPAVSTRLQYYTLIHRDHLSDTGTYRELTPTAAHNRLKAICRLVRAFLRDHQTKTVLHYGASVPRLTSDGLFIQQSVEHSLQTSMDTFLRDGVLPPGAHPFAYFYALAKIHKPTLQTRPITSVSGSILHGLGLWLDEELKKVVAKLDYVTTSSSELAATLQALPPLPPNAVLFTADARSFYTNVDTAHALSVIADFFASPAFAELHCDVSGPAILAGLTLLMRHSLFTFDRKFYVQLTGTAMGTPPAPMYATLYFFLHERVIVPPCPHVGFYTRYIDDAFGIWIPPDASPGTHWTDFVQSFDGFGKLKWDFSSLSTSAVFLDLSLSVRDGRIHVALYEKPQNLYLYIPPISCHPPGFIKGLILGGRHRIARLCSDKADRRDALERFLFRLQQRGYSRALLHRILSQSSAKAPPSAAPPSRLLILHCRYSPSRHIRRIRKIFATTLAHFPGEGPLTSLRNSLGHRLPPYRFLLAFHRQPNLRDTFSLRKFTLQPDPAT